MNRCLLNGAVPCLSIDWKTSPKSIFLFFRLTCSLHEFYPAWFQFSFFFRLGKGATIKPIGESRSNKKVSQDFLQCETLSFSLWIDKSKELEDDLKADFKCRSNQTIMIVEISFQITPYRTGTEIRPSFDSKKVKLCLKGVGSKKVPKKSDNYCTASTLVRILLYSVSFYRSKSCDNEQFVSLVTLKSKLKFLVPEKKLLELRTFLSFTYEISQYEVFPLDWPGIIWLYWLWKRQRFYYLQRVSRRKFTKVCFLNRSKTSKLQ